MSYMFCGSHALTTIYAGSEWNTNKVTVSDYMFYNCIALKGQNGTAYNGSYTTKTYARIDSASSKGYFTQK